MQLLVVPEQVRQGDTQSVQVRETLSTKVLLGHDTMQVELYKYPEIQVAQVLYPPMQVLQGDIQF